MKIALVLLTTLILAFLFSGLSQGFVQTGTLAFELAPEQALACFVTAALALLLQRASHNDSAPIKVQRTAAPTSPRKAPAGATGKAAAASANSQQGTVKWFNPNKGFGFISCADGSEVFVHYRNIQGGGRRVLRQGQSVRFNIITGDKGPQAEDVTPID